MPNALKPDELYAKRLRREVAKRLERNKEQRQNFDALSDSAASTYGPNTYEEWVKSVEKPGSWSNYVEAVELAKLYDVNLNIVFMTNKREKWPAYKSKAAGADNTVTLYFHRDHWSSTDVSNSTTGDGNCLYNAFSQCLIEIDKLRLNPYPDEQEHEVNTDCTSKLFNADRIAIANAEIISTPKDGSIEKTLSDLSTAEMSGNIKEKEQCRKTLVNQLVKLWDPNDPAKYYEYYEAIDRLDSLKKYEDIIKIVEKEIDKTANTSRLRPTA